MIAIVALSFLALGCNKPAEDNTDGAHEIVNQDAHSSDHDHGHSDDGHGHDHADDGHESAKPLGADGELVLNGSDKWEADEHTNKSVANMHEMVEKFKMQKEKDYSALVEDLKNEVRSLVSGCKMQGAEHDQLHIWLNDYMNLIVKLSDDTDNTGKEIALNNLAESLHNYTKYFK